MAEYKDRTVTKTTPEVCELCHQNIRHFMSRFIDGKTAPTSKWGGRWANMCVVCHRKYGVGLGTSRGQLYQVSPDSSYGIKIGG